MAKSIFTQGLVILFESAPDLEALRKCLSGFAIVKQTPGGDEPWLSGPSLMVEFRPEVNGYVSVDVVSARWPDHMGDTKKEMMLVTAWSMGHFGPLAYPFGLRRAVEQSWRWKGAHAAVDRHTAFVRLRLSYFFGAAQPVMPKDCNAERELQFLTRLAGALLNGPAAICYFNPNGELLLPKAAFDDCVKYGAEHEIPPLNLWSNVRFFKVEGPWLLMDSVGNQQLDILDQEVAFPNTLCSPAEVDEFIRDTEYYLLTKGDVIKDGDTIEGPGHVRWQGKRFETGMIDPPRETFRWFPCGQKEIPKILFREKPSEPAKQKGE